MTLNKPQRHTVQRQLVLRFIKLSARPQSAEDVWRAVRRHDRDIGQATIYRNLQLLVRRGEIFRTDSRDGLRRYIGQPWHAAMFTCQRCGKERRLRSRTRPAYVDRKMFGDQIVVVSELTATGLCGGCARELA